MPKPSELTCRYRTQLCNDGIKCRRHICFFAHSLEELRVPTCKPFVPPDALAAATTAAAADIARKVTIVLQKVLDCRQLQPDFTHLLRHKLFPVYATTLINIVPLLAV